LIEVLVVVAIIALLIAILLPSLARARAQARSTVCMTHERQIGTAMNIFSIESKGRVPRGLSRHGGTIPYKAINWLRMIVRMFGDKRNYAENFNLVPVEKHEVFSCPERGAEYGARFLDFVVNSTDPRGPMNLNTCTPNPVSGTWYEVEGVTRIDKWKRASDVVYAMDAVEESWNVVDQGISLNQIRKDIAAIRALVDPNINRTGFDWFDVPGGKTFPTYKKYLDVDHAPRAAIKMHLNLGSNGVYADGHADLIRPPLESVGILKVMQFYAKKFGVDPKITSIITSTATSAAIDPCAAGDIDWQP